MPAEATRRDLFRYALGATAAALTGRGLLSPPDAAADDRTGYSVNIKDYGAVGDGITDDRAAIHAARDAAGVGGTLLFPAGTYLVEMLNSSDPGYVNRVGGLHANVAGQTWQLGSAELVLTGGQQDNLITITAPDVSIIGGTLNLSAIPGQYFFLAGVAVYSGEISGVVHGPHGSGAAGAVIRDVTINDAPSYAVWSISTSRVTVTECTITNFYQGAIVVTTAVNVTDDIYDIVVHGNRIETDAVAQAAGIGVGANDQGADGFDAGVSRVRRVRITDNVSMQPRGWFAGALDTGCIEMTNAEECVIDGNVTEGGGFGITTGYLRHVVISNNRCRGFRGIGVEVSGGLDNVTIVGNVLDADGAGGPFNEETGAQDRTGTLHPTISGIMSAGPRPFRDYTIANNTITGFTTAARTGGISLVNTVHPSAGGTFENVAITANNITAGGGTALFTGIAAGGPTANLTVSGNVIDGAARTPSNGVDLVDDTHTGVSIAGNSFSNLDTVALLTSALADISFTGNSVRNCGAVLETK